MITVPPQLAKYPELSAALVNAIGLFVDDAKDGITRQEARKMLMQASTIFVGIARNYDLRGDEKKAIVDLALVILLDAVGGSLIDTAATVIAGLLPWWIGWLPLVIGKVFGVTPQAIVARLADEIPGISQAAYDGLVSVLNRMRIQA
jgi:hypothetical protein